MPSDKSSPPPNKFFRSPVQQSINFPPTPTPDALPEFQRYMRDAYPSGGTSSGTSPVADPTACEYVIIAFNDVQSVNYLPPFFCTDAAEMQRVVERLKSDLSLKSVVIFKRMLAYRTKVEWEAVEVDA